MNPANKTGLNPKYVYKNDPMVMQLKNKIQECIEEKRKLGEKLLKLRSSGTTTMAKYEIVRAKIELLNGMLCYRRQILSGNI